MDFLTLWHRHIAKWLIVVGWLMVCLAMSIVVCGYVSLVMHGRIEKDTLPKATVMGLGLGVWMYWNDPAYVQGMFHEIFRDPPEN